MQCSVASQNHWMYLFIPQKDIQSVSDELSMQNASLRVIRYSIYIFAHLKKLPDIWWKIANATNLIALLRMPVSFYYLSEEIQFAWKASGNSRFNHCCKATGKIGAFAAQCLQLFKCIRKYGLSVYSISEKALLIFGSIGFLFGMIGVIGHAKVALQSYAWLKKGYNQEEMRCKIASHLLAMASIIINSIALVSIQALGLLLVPYIMLGSTAIFTMIRYGYLKPRIHE